MRTSDLDKVAGSSTNRLIATTKKKSLQEKQSDDLNSFWSTVFEQSERSCFLDIWKRNTLSFNSGGSPVQSSGGMLARDTQHIVSFFLTHNNTGTASLYGALLCSSSYLKDDQEKPSIYLEIINYFFSSFQKILEKSVREQDYIQTSLAAYPHIKNDKVEILIEQLYTEFRNRDRKLVIGFINHFPDFYRMVCRLTNWEVSEEELFFLEKTVRDIQRETAPDKISTSALARGWRENLDLLAPPDAIDNLGGRKIMDNIDFQKMSYAIPETIFSDKIQHRKLTLSADRVNSFKDVMRLWKNSIQSYLSKPKYTAEQLSIQEYMYEMLLSIGKEKSIESAWALNILSALDTQDIPFDFWFTMQLLLQRKREEIPGANFGLMVIYCFNVVSMPASHLPFYNIMWPDIFCSLFGRYTYRFLHDASMLYFENTLKKHKNYHIHKDALSNAIKKSLCHDDLDGSQGFVAYAREWEEKFPGRAQRAKFSIKAALEEGLSHRKNSSPKMIHTANYASPSTVSFGSPLLASSGPSGPLTPISQSSGSSSTLSLSPAKPEDFEHYMQQRQPLRFTDATFSVLSEKLAKTFPKTSENISVDTILNDSVYKLEQYDHGKTIERCIYKIAYRVQKNGHAEERILGEKEIHLSKHPSDNAYVYQQILSTKKGRFVLSATFKEQGECHALSYVVTVPDNAAEYYTVKRSLEDNEGYLVSQKALRYRVYENRKGCSDLRPYSSYKREQPSLGNYIVLNEMVRNPKYQRPVEVHNQYMSYPLYVSYGRDADDAIMQGPLTRYPGYTIYIQKEKGKNTEWNLTFQGDEGREDFIGKTLKELDRLEYYDYYNSPSAKVYAKNGLIDKIVYDSKAIMLVAENMNFNYPHDML